MRMNRLSRWIRGFEPLSRRNLLRELEFYREHLILHVTTATGRAYYRYPCVAARIMLATTDPMLQALAAAASGTDAFPGEVLRDWLLEHDLDPQQLWDSERSRWSRG